MHREIDAAGQQCFLDLFGEEPLAAGVGKRPVLHDVTGGADDLDLDRRGIDARRRGQPALHFTRLHQRQRRTARTDAQEGNRACRLCHMAFKCYARVYYDNVAISEIG